MEAALAVLGIQGVLGAYDNFRNHEFHEGLPHKSHQRFELLLHAAREAFYLVLFPTMAWMEWRGWLAYAFGIVIVGEIVITCWDFVEEDRTRKLSANERVLHTILTLNYGAFLALLAPVLVDWAGRPTGLAFINRGFWSWLMTLYSLGVLIFAIRELSSGLAMWRESQNDALNSPHVRAIAADVQLPAVLRNFHDGSGVRTATGLVSVTVGRGLAGVLLKFMGLEMRTGRQNLVVSFEPDGQGELWQRTFETGCFTSRFKTEGVLDKTVVELFGPFAFCYDFLVGADEIIWKLRRVRLFGIPMPAAFAPRVAAREWVSSCGAYEMSASVAVPLLGHLLSYTGTLARTPVKIKLADAV